MSGKHIEAKPPLHLVQALVQAVEVVGDVLGSNADCVSAAAMISLVGERLGFELRVVPVSLIAHRYSTPESWVFMGPRALPLMPEGSSDDDESPAAKDRHNGHLVVFCVDPPMLLDPNIRQLNSHGFDVPSVALPVSSSPSTQKPWSVRIGDTDLLWQPDENTRLLSSYERARADPGNADAADRIVGLLRRGLSARQIHQMYN